MIANDRLSRYPNASHAISHATNDHHVANRHRLCPVHRQPTTGSARACGLASPLHQSTPGEDEHGDDGRAQPRVGQQPTEPAADVDSGQ